MRCWVCGQASEGVRANNIIVCLVMSEYACVQVVLLSNSCKSNSAYEVMVC